MPLTLRAASSADAHIIVDFNQKLAQETEGKMLDPGLLSRGVAALLGDPAKGRYFLAEEDGVILGQAMVTFEWSDWRNGWIWWVQSVYVRVDARRKGVFRSLYEHLKKTADMEAQAVALRLYVERDNLVAQKTYASLGMSPTSYLIMERCPL